MTGRPTWTPVLSGDELPEGDFLTWTCGEALGNGQTCNAWIQGGRRGLGLHREVVHPDRETRRA